MKCCQHAPLDELTSRLRRRQIKLTRPRLAVLEVLRSQHRPLSVSEIHRALSRDKCDLASVYRSIRALEKAGVVKAFRFGNGPERYELLAEGDDGHHHHLVCTRCDTVREIEECELGRIETALTHRSGFRSVTHRLEFFGVCPDCQ
jgi:Fe2+ or Zn2+ uptake regulation protein